MGGTNQTLGDELTATKKNLTTASEGVMAFITHYNSCLAVFDRVEERHKELAGKEAELDAKEQEKQAALDSLQHERELKNLEREDAIKKREGEVLAKEERWNEIQKQRESEVLAKEEHWLAIEKRMELNAAKLPSVVQLNVSGARFAATKEMLLKLKGSLFEQMIVSDYSQQLPSGELFFERDPKLFPHIVSFILTGILPEVSSSKQAALIKEFEHFQIEIPSLANASASTTEVGNATS